MPDGSIPVPTLPTSIPAGRRRRRVGGRAPAKQRNPSPPSVPIAHVAAIPRRESRATDPRWAPFLALVTLALSNVRSWQARRAFTEAVARMIEEALLWRRQLSVADGATALASLTLLRAWHLHVDASWPEARHAAFHAEALDWIAAHPTSDGLNELVRYAVDPPSDSFTTEAFAHFLFRWAREIGLPLVEAMQLLTGVLEGNELQRDAEEYIEQVHALETATP